MSSKERGQPVGQEQAPVTYHKAIVFTCHPSCRIIHGYTDNPILFEELEELNRYYIVLDELDQHFKISAVHFLSGTPSK